MAGISGEEYALLDKFRTKVAPLNIPATLQDDLFLVRWIRARDGDLDKALEMLTKHMKWRVKHDYDNILSWTPSPEMSEMCPIEFLGLDEDNSPVIWAPYGTWKLKEAAARDKKEYIKYWHWLIATLSLKMKGKFTRKGEPVSKFVMIMDFKDFSLSTLASVSTLDMCLKAIKQFEKNHPETAKTFYCINASAAFDKLYSLAKPLLAAKTQEKMSIVAKEETWKPLLQSNLPADVLPVRYGGENPVLK